MPREPRKIRKVRLEGSGKPARAAAGNAASAGATRRKQLHHVILWSVLGLLLLYLSIGIWPILPVEGDEMAIANGAAKLAYTPDRVTGIGVYSGRRYVPSSIWIRRQWALLQKIRGNRIIRYTAKHDQ